MANLIIQENGQIRYRPAVNGEEITIQAPCNCSEVTGVQINNVAFPFYDAVGNSLENIRGKFTEGSLIRVMIDTVNVRAYILNSPIAAPTHHTHGANEVTSGVLGGQIAANSDGQAINTYLLRNSKLKNIKVNGEETPSINGEICWQYV